MKEPTATIPLFEFVGELYPYQAEDVTVLTEKHRQVLAYPTGVGKTVVALAALNYYRSVLVVAPKHLLKQWESEIARFIRVPTGMPITYRFVDRMKARNKALMALQARTDFKADVATIGLINYAMLHRMEQPLLAAGYNTVIFDEAHYLCNRQSKRSRICRLLAKRAKYCYALTATPRYTEPQNFWHLLHIMNPIRFNSYWTFFERYVHYWTHPQRGAKIPTGKIKNEGRYHKIVAEYTVERPRSVVTVPELSHGSRVVDLAPRHRKIYNTLEEGIKDESGVIHIPNILALITLLRKASTSLSLLSDVKSDCPKADMVVSLMTGIETQTIVFTHFRASKDICTTSLKKSGFTVADIDTLDDWLSGKAQVLVDTYYKGGLGLNLQQATDLIYFEPPNGFVPMTQSKGRIQRPNSPHANQYIWRVTADNTVEDRIWKQLDNQDSKATEASIAVAVARELMKKYA